MHEPGLGGESAERHAGLRRGEIDDAVDRLEEISGIVRHGDAEGARSGQCADIGADMGGAARLEPSGHVDPFRLMKQAAQDAAHAAGGASDGDPHSTPSTIKMSASPAWARLALADWYSVEW